MTIAAQSLPEPVKGAIGYSVIGIGPTHFPGPLAPATDAAHRANGYSSDMVELDPYIGSLDVTHGLYTL